MNPKKTNKFNSEQVEESESSSPCPLSHIPNEITRKALENAEQRKNLTHTKNLEDLLRSFG